jgi:hypothetical protein
MSRFKKISLLVLIWNLSLASSIYAATPIINEFVARNDSEPPLRTGDLLDEDGDPSDWIEIYNPTDDMVNLDGWFLTDDADNLQKWECPAIEIAPGGFGIVFASGKDRRDSEEELHTNFQLRAGGEFLALINSQIFPMD